MDDDTERRIGANEAAFRKVNESLRAGKTLVAADRLFPFRCECGVLGCNRLIELTLPEYESVRAHAARFTLLDGHEIPETEHIVHRTDRHVVVEKQSAAARIATDTDPRG
ncbi:MAG: hypothetical protein H0V81_05205 [Solirubrobacterales bacterium]|nr:hypothetical protein [Solirubrobacterales bacterium]